MDASQFVRQRLDDPNDQRQLPQYNPLSPENVAATYAREKFNNAVSYAKAPGDAMMGQMDPMSDDGFRRIQGLAMGAFTGGMPIPLAPPHSLGMFMRARPEGGNALNVGRFKGTPELQEVPDNMATLSMHNLPPLPRGMGDPSAHPVPLSTVLRHNRMYEHDPSVGEIPTMLSRPGEGRYDTGRGMLFVDPSGNPGHQRANVLENVQHAINHREGFPITADPSQVHEGEGGIMSGMADDSRARIIEKLVGTQMAKATRARRDMTGAQRAERPPERDMSVPMDQQIVHRKRDWE
jgi:hypothetical protein